MAPRPRLMLVLGSTRPGRVGLPVSRWFAGRVREHGAFELDEVDLAELALPMLDEPNHPRLRQYTKPHTNSWSARVESADALVFVVAEYNHGYPAPIKNAIDFLHHEWADKAIGFVSYGGVAAGTRSLEQLLQVVTVLRMVPSSVAVNIPFVTQFLGEDGELAPNDVMQQASFALLDELGRLNGGLRALREASPREQ